mmetsp:Transcript_75098/g.200409  ORF Transcript_75098/g.200409 Transcript_75098/m.200409 type:complete len:201 (-) Transcript_75098:2985-3587(-)
MTAARWTGACNPSNAVSLGANGSGTTATHAATAPTSSAAYDTGAPSCSCGSVVSTPRTNEASPRAANSAGGEALSTAVSRETTPGLSGVLNPASRTAEICSRVAAFASSVSGTGKAVHARAAQAASASSAPLNFAALLRMACATCSALADAGAGPGFMSGYSRSIPGSVPTSLPSAVRTTTCGGSVSSTTFTTVHGCVPR